MCTYIRTVARTVARTYVVPTPICAYNAPITYYVSIYRQLPYYSNESFNEKLLDETN